MTKKLKIFSLHARFSSFYAACFGQCVEKDGAEIQMVCERPNKQSPFDNTLYQKAKVDRIWFNDELSITTIKNLVTDFSPDLILVSGWMIEKYLRVCRWFRRRGGLVVAFSDSQYKGSIRQRIGCLLAPFYLHSAIDLIWAAGERQRAYAAKLGYTGNRCRDGALCPDWHSFAAHRYSALNRDRTFLFVGRFIPVKGIANMREAYRQYRLTVDNPWGLTCLGTGPLRSLLENEPGIVLPGFLQPDQLPAAMANAAAFVLPSLKERWGVVLQEAAALGHPLITTEACGSAVHMLRHGWNGFLVETDNIEALSRAMIRMHELSDREREEMGNASFLLSQQYTPDVWTKTLMEIYEEATRT